MRAVLVSFVAATLVALSGCATMDGGASGPPAAAPAVKVGDQWTYHARDGFRAAVDWTETHEVVAAGPDGISVRVTLDGPTVSGSRIETWTAPGTVTTGSLMDIETRRFAVPLQRYAFPMAPGQTWNQWVDDFNEATRKAGQINRYVRVGGWETVATPAGSFQALRLRVFMRLDDEEFWRGPTQCNYLVWYAPSVGASVREEKSAEYWEKGSHRDGIGAIRAQNTLMQLVSFRRGA
jgi:hypothetical protein